MSRAWILLSSVRPELWAFALAFAAFALMAAPGITWMDSGELAASAFTLGGAHPPGHPAHTLLGKLAALLPVGEIGFRIAILSALTMAAAVAGLVRLCRLLVPAEPAAALVAGLVAASLAVLSPIVQVNATRVEVYAPVAALLVWAMVAMVGLIRPRAHEPRDGRLLLAAALACGLAAAFHPVIALAASLPMAVFALAHGRARLRRLVPAALLLGLLGLAAYLYLPVRAHAASPPLLMWGEPATPAALADVLGAPAYRGNFSLRDVPGRFGELVFLCGEGAGAGLLWGGLAGLVFAVLTRLRTSGLILATALAVILGAATQEHMNPDMPGYVLVGLLLLATGLAPLAAAALRLLIPPDRPATRPATQPADRDLPRPWRHAIAALVLAPLVGFALMAPTVRALDSGFRRTDDALAWWTRTVALMPPGPGVYFANHDHSLFAAQYERLVAGGRPDIAVASTELCRDRWFLTHLERSLPELHVPFMDDESGGSQRGPVAARLAAENLARARAVGGDEPGLAGLERQPAWPMGRAYLIASAPVDPATLPPPSPPPRYHGDVGARISGLIALVRSRYELDQGRLGHAALALGLAGRFDEQATQSLFAATPGPERPPLQHFLPRPSRVFIHEPWQTELMADEIAWRGGLGPPYAPDAAALPLHAPVERRLHALWRSLLAPAANPGQALASAPALAISALGRDAEMATAQMLAALGRDHQAETFLRAVIDRRGADHKNLMLLGSIIGNRPSPAAHAEAETLFARAAELAPAGERAEPLVRLGLAQIKQNKKEAARQSWQAALALDPGRSDVARLLAEIAGK